MNQSGISIAAALENEAELALAHVQSTGRSVKIVYMNGLSYFVFADDWPAANINPKHVFDSLDELKQASKKDPIALPGECRSFDGVEFELMRKLFTALPSATILDIGANYGREGIRYAYFRRQLAAEAEFDHQKVDKPCIFAFEPHPVRHLATLNYVLHDTPEIHLFPYAVSAEESFASLTIAQNNTLGGSIAVSAEGRQSMLVRTRRLDTILQNANIDTPLFLKVDTQGNEPLVLEGLGDYIRDNPICGVFEFSPPHLQKTADPNDFLKSLCDKYAVYDIGTTRRSQLPLKKSNTRDLIVGLRGSTPNYTDLLLVDRRLEL